MPKISIIMPLFNAAMHVEKSVQSFLKQSLTDIELIIINDFSTDESLELVKLYLKDKRIRLINNEKNLGVFASRNIGVFAANAKLILFMDADDCLHERACEIAFKLQDKADILCFEALVNRKKAKAFYKFKDDKLYQRDEFLTFLSSKKHFINSVWAKLFKKELITQALALIDYKQRLNYSEDLLFCYLNFFFAKSVFCSKAQIYTYNFNENGLYQSNDLALLKGHLKDNEMVLKLIKSLSKRFKHKKFNTALIFALKNESRNLKYRIKKLQGNLKFYDMLYLRIRKKAAKIFLNSHKISWKM